MLIDRNTINGNLSMYECDRCKAKITRPETWTIKAGHGAENAKTICHLCDKCYKALERGLKKGV